MSSSSGNGTCATCSFCKWNITTGRETAGFRDCPKRAEKLSGKGWTSAGNRASLVPLRERQRLSRDPAGSIACAGLRWWRRKRPLQPNKGSQPCLSRSCHQTRPGPEGPNALNFRRSGLTAAHPIDKRERDTAHQYARIWFPTGTAIQEPSPRHSFLQRKHGRPATAFALYEGCLILDRGLFSARGARQVRPCGRPPMRARDCAKSCAWSD
jgi:hypothetical protein